MADDSDSSSLSSAPDEEVKKLAPIFFKAKQAKNHYVPKSSPPRPKRQASPPHEEVLADNADIAFVVMFRSRFNDAFPSKLAYLGPQDIEGGVTGAVPMPQVESLLCALLALVLNRKKPVERGHHGRALEEAVLSQKSQWPHSWNGVNPLHGNRDFTTMSPVERLNLLRTLAIWSMTSSEAITAIIKEKYKQARHSDDENQPLSVQPWGVDNDKRRYFLIQGLDDTTFRVYREGSRYTKNAHWWSVAGSIDELRTLATKLEEVDGTQAARRLAAKITNAIPTFEASEEKRRRREYRQGRRAAFTRPEPGFSLYEGRTRGKRMRYTYDDDDESDATSARRSTRQSARTTPFEAGPTYTASGRQIKQPRTGDYGESLLSNGVGHSTDELAPDHRGERDEDDDDEEPVRPGGRATRSGGKPAVNGASNSRKRKHLDGYNSIDDMSEEEDAGASGDDWDSDRNEAQDEHMPDAEDEKEDVSDDSEEEEEDDGEEDESPRSLVVKLRLPPDDQHSAKQPRTNGDPEAHQHGEVDAESSAAANEATQSGAPQSEPVNPAHGSSAQLNAPSVASSYPTPASASFPAAGRELKPTAHALQTRKVSPTLNASIACESVPNGVALGSRVDSEK